SSSFEDHLPALVASGAVPIKTVDEAVANLLRVKFRLGLFDDAARDRGRDDTLLAEEFLEDARAAARESVVMLKNDGTLPLAAPADGARPLTVAVIGPLADAPHEQLGTWTFDSRKETTVTPLAALRERLGAERVLYAPGLANSRSRDSSLFGAAEDVARAADAVLFFGGEEAILSGEAHSRADLRLPGAQEALIERLAALGKPLVLTVISGRPNTLEAVLESASAILIAWHPGTMGGPAIVDLLMGDGGHSPSGRLPVTWPISAGQVPIYYNHKNTGRPAPPPEELRTLDEIPEGAWQSSLSNTSRYLDIGALPRFPFGFGLTYGDFRYRDLKVEPAKVPADGAVTVRFVLENAGERRATEVAQLYSRDVVGRLTPPLRELRDWRRVSLEPVETR
ncbi:MAG: glycoside hydrolase family 3 C-terminal domain-containing protein, partial [Acidobacteriota bacterium]